MRIVSLCVATRTCMVISLDTVLFEWVTEMITRQNDLSTTAKMASLNIFNSKPHFQISRPQGPAYNVASRSC